jgi:hypothetical protein
LTERTEAQTRNEPPYPPRPLRPLTKGEGVQGGMFAGAAGGAALLCYVALAGSAAGYDAWAGVKLAAAPWLGGRVLLPGFDALAVVLGLVGHFTTATAWGMSFGAFFYGATPGGTIALGALWGMLVWLAMFYVVLPLFGVGQLAVMIPVGAAALSHLVFGLVLAAAFLPFQQVRRAPRFAAIARALRLG